MEEKMFQVVSFDDFNFCEILNADDLYNFFVEEVDEPTADTILDWAAQAESGELFDAYPAIPYMVVCQ